MAIMMFADFTASGIAVFHKTAQLLLVDYSTPILSYKFRALSLAGSEFVHDDIDFYFY